MLSKSWLAFVFAIVLPIGHAQDVDLASVLAAPSPVFVEPPYAVELDQPDFLTTTSAAAVPTDTAVAQRDIIPRDGDCSPQPTGAGPVPTPDTVEAFLAASTFQAIRTPAALKLRSF